MTNCFIFIFRSDFKQKGVIFYSEKNRTHALGTGTLYIPTVACPRLFFFFFFFFFFDNFGQFLPEKVLNEAFFFDTMLRT